MNELSRAASEEALPVVVIGAGFAGVAAAWSAARRGARVMLVHGASGASGLYSGIVDGEDASAEVRELGRALGLRIAEAPRALATREGVVRTALGRDAALLDLEALAGKRIGVADLGRDDFDAELLVKSFGSSAWAERTRSTFVCVHVDGLAAGSERRISPYDLARLFDEEPRRRALASALVGSVDAWLLGPWLGVEADVAGELTRALGRRVGEVSSPLGGAAGARFELRRAALLSELGVRTITGDVRSVKPASVGRSGPPPLEVELDGGDRLLARAVVLAVGGVGAAGIELSAPDARLPRACHLSLEADVLFDLDSEVFDGVSSLAGVSFQTVGLGALERLGVRVDEAGNAGSARLYAAGDVVAARPRTVLAALESGILAGTNAALAGSAVARAQSRSMS